MVTETNSEAVLDAKAESMLRELFGADLTCLEAGVWKVGDGESALWAVYLPDAGPMRKEEGELPEPALELIRPLEEVGSSGSVRPEDAARHLRAMSKFLYLRLAQRVHPDASGRLIFAAVATLYLDGLDLPELKTTADEILGIEAVHGA